MDVEVPNDDGADPALRADAKANRERIIQVATRLFEQCGPEVSMARIAKEAQVGSGTLYRHFPDRGQLIESIYRDRVGALTAEVARYRTDTASGLEALRVWSLDFMALVMEFRTSPAALTASLSSNSDYRAHSRARLFEAVQFLLREGEADGSIRPGIQPVQILRMLAGYVYTAANAAEAVELLDLTLRGIAER